MTAEATDPERAGETGSTFSLRRHALFSAGTVLVGLVLLSAAFAPIISPYSPYDLDVSRMLLGPSYDHWLGTDEVGRDVLSRTIFAARISVEVALVAVGVGLTGGAVIGIIAAYAGGLVDLLLCAAWNCCFRFRPSSWQ